MAKKLTIVTNTCTHVLHIDSIVVTEEEVEDTKGVNKIRKAKEGQTTQ
jgi:phosphopantetheine adenylyltransferase